MSGVKFLEMCIHIPVDQQAPVTDVGAKVLADNIGSMMCIAAANQADLGLGQTPCR